MKKIILLILMTTSLLSAQQALFDSLESSLTDVDSTNRVTVLNDLARVYRPVDTEKSLQYAGEAIALSETRNDLKGRLEGLLQLGRTLRRITRFEEALSALHKAKSICNADDDYVSFTQILNNIGFVYRDMEQYEQAMSFHLDALHILEEKENRNIAFVYNHISNIYRLTENYDQALHYAKIALEYHEKFQNENGIGYAKHRLGAVYEAIGQLDTAITWFTLGLEARESLDQTYLVGHSLLRIGRIHLLKNRYEEALYSFTRAMSNFDEVGNLRGVAFAKIDIAKVKKNTGHAREARKHFREGLRIQSNLSDKTEMAATYCELSEIALMDDNFTMALSLMKLSIKLAEETSNMHQLQKCYLGMSNIYQKQSDFSNALKFHEQYHQLVDTLNRQAMQSKLTNLQINFELERKEREFAENAVLQNLKMEQQRRFRNNLLIGTTILLIFSVTMLRTNRIKSKANQELIEARDKIQEQNKKLENVLEELRQTNATKDTFFSIIAHDLKSALQVQFSGSRLLSERIEGLKKENIIEIANGLKTNIQLLFKLLENLIHWSRIQMGRLKPHLEQLQLNELASNNQELFEPIAAQKNITIKNEIPDDIHIYADKNMMFSVLGNLIMNGVKYSHAGGEVILSAEIDESSVSVCVRDHGIGISKDDIKKLFLIDQHHSTFGTANEKGTGLGLILCKDFVEANGGAIIVDSQPEKGTEVTFSVPLSAGNDSRNVK